MEQPGHELHVLLAREALLHSGVLPREPDPGPDAMRVVGHVDAVDERLPAVGAQQRREQAHHRRLARAVRTEQPVDRAPRHLEVDAIERDRAPEALHEGARVDCEIVRHPASLSERGPSARTICGAPFPVRRLAPDPLRAYAPPWMPPASSWNHSMPHSARPCEASSCAPSTTSTFSALYEAWLEYALLLFPGQFLTREEQDSFARRVGDLEFGAAPISNIDRDGKVHSATDDDIVKALRGNEGWHHDSTYMPVQAKGAVFSAEIVPSSGAATGFADMRQAYDVLDDATKQLISGLNAHHSLEYSQGRAGYLPRPNAQGLLPGYGYHGGDRPLRPLVKVHPETGRPNLLAGRHAHDIVGMSPAESEALLDRLNEDACDGTRTYHHEWTVGDALLWDNRCLMHRATPFDMAEPRRMWQHAHRRRSALGARAQLLLIPPNCEPASPPTTSIEPLAGGRRRGGSARRRGSAPTRRVVGADAQVLNGETTVNLCLLGGCAATTFTEQSGVMRGRPQPKLTLRQTMAAASLLLQPVRTDNAMATLPAGEAPEFSSTPPWSSRRDA